MTAKKIKESGPRDLGKMVRQLSLVAYLMSLAGRKVDAETIRWQVEGYGDEDQSLEAFARRFYADREELRALGIEISSSADQFGGGDVYWLAPENYFLPALELEPEELAALHACLTLLDGQFAYSRALRLALQSLALGSGNSLNDPVTSCVSVNLLSAGFDAALAEKQAKLETAISRRKTIVFDYHALSRESIATRKVDPYQLMINRGEWYLIGYAHEREDIRLFKLDRIQGKIRYADKAEHNFSQPADFQIQPYLNREPWQLGPIQGRARLRFSPQLGWWAAQNLAHCGEVRPEADGSAAFFTDYADADPLCSLVLSLGGEVRIVEPQDLEQRLTALLETIAQAHSGAPPFLAEPSGPASRRPTPPRPPAQIEPERFSQLARTISYLLDKLGGAESTELDLGQACRDLGFAGRKQLAQALELLRLVNIGAGGYLIEAYAEDDRLRVIGWPEGELLQIPARLSPREARALLLAIDMVGSQLLSTRYPSLESARQKIIAAAGGEDPSIPVGVQPCQGWSLCRTVNLGLEQRRLVEIEFLSGSGELTRRPVEPYLINNTKGQWYLVAYCRLRPGMRTFRFSNIKSARLLEERFPPRPAESLQLERFQRDPQTPSGEAAPQSARVWFSPAIARWVGERRLPAVTPLQDGSLIASVPFFSVRWLINELLKYRGQAVLLTPAELRAQVAAAARELADPGR